jgi:hypothetical protein
MKLKKIILSELSTIGGGGGSAGDDVPEPQYILPGKKRVLDDPKGKPEPWMERGGYTQVEFPKATQIFGKGSGKDSESQQVFGRKYIKNTGVKYQLDLDAFVDEYETFEDIVEESTMKLQNILTEDIFMDSGTVVPSQFVKFIANYKKLNPENRVIVDKAEMKKLESEDPVYIGYNKKSRKQHWKYIEDDYELHYDRGMKQKALGLINFSDAVKKDHPWS